MKKDDKKKQEQKKDSKFPEANSPNTQSGRVDTGSSSSSIPERATERHTERSPKPTK